MGPTYSPTTETGRYRVLESDHRAFTAILCSYSFKMLTAGSVKEKGILYVLPGPHRVRLPSLESKERESLVQSLASRQQPVRSIVEGRYVTGGRIGDRV